MGTLYLPLRFVVNIKFLWRKKKKEPGNDFQGSLQKERILDLEIILPHFNSCSVLTSLILNKNLTCICLFFTCVK